MHRCEVYKISNSPSYALAHPSIPIFAPYHTIYTMYPSIGTLYTHTPVLLFSHVGYPYTSQISNYRPQYLQTTMVGLSLLTSHSCIIPTFISFPYLPYHYPLLFLTLPLYFLTYPIFTTTLLISLLYYPYTLDYGPLLTRYVPYRLLQGSIHTLLRLHVVSYMSPKKVFEGLQETTRRWEDRQGMRDVLGRVYRAIVRMHHVYLLRVSYPTLHLQDTQQEERALIGIHTRLRCYTCLLRPQ